ncbi:MAG: hypothetical protein R3D34_06775 [Nitratireductor sp.]
MRSRFEERRIRIPYTPEIRADLRQVTKQVTPSGNIRFTAERNADGHADRFWALALAIQAADGIRQQPWRPLAGAGSAKPEVAEATVRKKGFIQQSSDFPTPAIDGRRNAAGNRMAGFGGMQTAIWL